VVPVNPSTAYAPAHSDTYVLDDRVSQRPKYRMFESAGEPSPVAAEAGCTAVVAAATTATTRATARDLVLRGMVFLLSVHCGRSAQVADQRRGHAGHEDHLTHEGHGLLRSSLSVRRRVVAAESVKLLSRKAS
jgi:hypothetical protein